MTTMQSKRDYVLMSYFRNNSRENLTKISRQTHIPISTIFDKLRQFEESLIKKHTTLVDFKQIGFDIRVNILFKVAKDSRDEFREFLMKSFNINSIFRVNNGFDYLVEAIFRDMSDLNRFLEQLEAFHIENRQELFVLEDIKRECFLSDTLHAEMLAANR